MSREQSDRLGAVGRNPESTLDTWLSGQVVEAYDALVADPARGISSDALRERRRERAESERAP